MPPKKRCDDCGLSFAECVCDLHDEPMDGGPPLFNNAPGDSDVYDEHGDRRFDPYGPDMIDPETGESF